jgi:hypothetical protein
LKRDFFFGRDLAKVIDGYVISSILNTKTRRSLVKLNEIEPVRNPTSATEGKQKDREKKNLGGAEITSSE